MIKLSGLCLHPFRAGILVCTAFLLLACGTVANSNSYRAGITPEGFMGSRHMHLNLLGSLGISSAPVNQLPVVELSDLAWDRDAETLYAVSDNGYLYTISLIIRQQKLIKAKFVKAVRLKGADNKPLRRAFRDTEGLAIRNANNNNPHDAELLISFEGKTRTDRYSTSGQYLGNVPLTKKLQNRHNYRHGNKMLESVAIHPKYGVLVAAELPLKSSNKRIQTIYSQHGKAWHFPRLSAPESSVTALEVLGNGDILVLERAYSGLLNPLVISLRQIHLNQCNSQNHCAVKDLAIFNSAEGWNIDNFEGLTHLQGKQYLMVSDDNKNPLQQTLMVMFEIIP